MTTKVEHEQRLRVASRLLENGVRYSDVVRHLQANFKGQGGSPISERTAKRVIAAATERWRTDAAETEAEAHLQGIRKCEDWLRRLEITDRNAAGYVPMSGYKRSRAVGYWLDRLLKLRGVFMGRVKDAKEMLPTTVMLGIPSYDEIGVEGEEDLPEA